MRIASFRDAEGAEIYYRAWDPAGSPRALVLVAHGMCEHSGRYARLGEACVEAGLACRAIDHRGHGLTGQAAGTLGYLGSARGFHALADDLDELAALFRAEYTGRVEADLLSRSALAAAGKGLGGSAPPLFLIGHSMGSFAALDYAERHGSALAGLLLLGTSGRQGVLSKVGIVLAALIARFRGAKRPSPFLTGLNFGPYALSVEGARTDCDWLSRDPAEVDAYLDDPLCGYDMTGGFYADFLPALARILAPRRVARIPARVPALVLVGSEDPVGGKGRLVDDLLASLSLRDEAWAELGVYDGARHELLNETCRGEVLADILAWIEERMAGGGGSA